MRFQQWTLSLGMMALLFAMAIIPHHAQAQSSSSSSVTLIPVGDEFMTEDYPDGPAFRSHAEVSNGGQVAHAVNRAATSGSLVLLPSGFFTSPNVVKGSSKKNNFGANVQVNDPGIDNIQTFPGTRPFEESTQSETSIVRVGNHVIVGYNSSAGEPIVKIGNSLFATAILLSGVSYSDDSGKTWTSGFITPPPHSVLTFGDPALAADRAGNVYYANLAGDQFGNTVVGVGKSTDFGHSWSTQSIVATDNGADKEWITTGPDPASPGRDNVYVTWTSFYFKNNLFGSELHLGISTDGGATFTTKTLFAPAGDALMSSIISFSNPVVDPSTGRLYIPFLHFSNTHADMIRVLVSDDGGATFNFLTFNVPGAADAFGYPNVTPGERVDCGQNNGGFRNVLHQGSDVGGGRGGLARYIHATRLITQPSGGAFRGRFFFAFQSSTSPFFGDPGAGSEIKVLYSQDGGTTWADPLTIAPSTPNDPQHVHPSLSVRQNGNELKVGYYVQQSDTKLRIDLATVHVDGNHLKVTGTSALSNQAFDITPSNIPFPIAGNPFFTTNYDRTIVACYNIGEYMSVAAGDDAVVAAWGDNRNSWTSPPTSPAAGMHAQADVFTTLLPK